MKKEKMKSLVEVHVCNYARDHDEDCISKGSKELTDKLKKWSKENHGKAIKIIRSGCLGKCSEGIAIACYPQKVFLLNVTPDDSKEIKKGLEEALEKALEG
ncbi:MAG TPA: (2Fe-2S) ferredoxin domain-containing protein [Bacteriovoracaceae bacterium]|nr:(2Fe-2S) ferredoxin domain-containing protein [Bacteriovoracaceae bacterium]